MEEWHMDDEYLGQISATGATLGVLALFLLLFLLVLCLPWRQCTFFRGLCARNRNSEVQRRNDEEYTINGTIIPYPFSDVALPAVLPKLPNYQECIDNHLILTDEAPPPATPPPEMERRRTRSASHGQPSSSNANIGDTEQLFDANETRSGDSTPPPAYSSFRSIRSLALQAHGMNVPHSDDQPQASTNQEHSCDEVAPDTQGNHSTESTCQTEAAEHQRQHSSQKPSHDEILPETPGQQSAQLASQTNQHRQQEQQFQPNQEPINEEGAPNAPVIPVNKTEPLQEHQIQAGHSDASTTQAEQNKKLVSNSNPSNDHVMTPSTSTNDPPPYNS